MFLAVGPAVVVPCPAAATVPGEAAEAPIVNERRGWSVHDGAG